MSRAGVHSAWVKAADFADFADFAGAAAVDQTANSGRSRSMPQPPRAPSRDSTDAVAVLPDASDNVASWIRNAVTRNAVTLVVPESAHTLGTGVVLALRPGR